MASVTRSRRAIEVSRGRTRSYGYAALGGALVFLVAGVLLPFGNNEYQGTTAFDATIFAMALVNGLYLFALYGLHRRYGARYGRLGLAFAVLLGLGLAYGTVGSAVVGVANTFGFAGSVHDIEAWGWFIGLVSQLVASLYGLVLWRRGILGLGGIVMAMTIPVTVVLVVVLDALTGRIDAAFGGPLALAWAGVGYAMLRDDDTGPA